MKKKVEGFCFLCFCFIIALLSSGCDNTWSASSAATVKYIGTASAMVAGGTADQKTLTADQCSGSLTANSANKTKESSMYCTALASGGQCQSKEGPITCNGCNGSKMIKSGDKDKDCDTTNACAADQVGGTCTGG